MLGRVLPAVCTALLLGFPTPVAADPGYTVQTLHFAVTIGPADDVACDIVGDLYVPAGVSTDNRTPAVLMTHGFNKTKDNLVATAAMLADAGYVVLAYSGLGFGGSGCTISMDSRDYDGKAASQLTGFLGGAPGVAYSDAAHQFPIAPLDLVTLDDAASHDPRVGMIGSSYGGQVQFAAAAIDRRIDALIPLDTWHDLSVALAPNSAANGLPGAAKLTWILGLSGVGAIAPGVSGYAADPARAAACPNFTPVICSIVGDAIGRGYPSPEQSDILRSVSVATYADRITVPVLLLQGQADTLFDLAQARATYDALERNGTETKMIWHRSGHSDTTTGDGAVELAHAGRILAWFDRYLRGLAVDTGPEFAYYRDWADDGVSSTVDVGDPVQFYLAPGGTLAEHADVTTGTQTFTTAPDGLPTGVGPLDPRPAIPVPTVAVPGTFVTWTGPPRTAPLDVVGAPHLHVTVDAPSTVVFVKLYDVAPDGTAQLINGHVAPARTEPGTTRLDVTMPPIVHRFDAGHSVRLEIAGGDLNFRGGPTAERVVVGAGPDQILTLPVTP